MLLHEVFNPPINGLQDVNDDNSRPVYRASRKTKLTLNQIRKLRRMMDLRAVEHKLHIEKVQRQYGPPQDEGVTI